MCNRGAGRVTMPEGSRNSYSVGTGHGLVNALDTHIYVIKASFACIVSKRGLRFWYHGEHVSYV